MSDDNVTVIREPVCLGCRFLLYWPICMAFLPSQGGIPKDVRDGKNDHHQPIEGDHGVQFAPLGETKIPDLTDDLKSEILHGLNGL